MLPLPILGFLLLAPHFCSPTFLPRPVQTMENLFRDLGHFLEDTQEGHNDEQTFEYSVDFSQLPPNYHNEEQKERKVGNATIFSRRKIEKMTNNQTGETVISQKTFTSIEEGDRGLVDQWRGCYAADDCQRSQYCHRSLFTSECRDCKVKTTECRTDAECCLGYLCVWGRCSDGVMRGENGTSCNPWRDPCAKGLCCTSWNVLSGPVCTPLPEEGEECWSVSTRLLGMMGRGPATSAWWVSCPCAAGLVCREKSRFHPVSTCQRPESGPDFAEAARASLLQPILRRDVELDYSADSLPWPLAELDLPRAAEERGSDAGDFGQGLTAKLAGGWEDESLTTDSAGDQAGPSQLDFRQLKELASQMGQYFEPGFN